jgi:hypothetical protein
LRQRDVEEPWQPLHANVVREGVPA